MSVPVADIVRAAARAWVDVRRFSPRVQALTNTVAQPITANLLLAAGARVSLATHAAEIADMSRTADAILINLGTLDAARVAAVPVVIETLAAARSPAVLDPVFVEHSALRRDLARQVLALPRLIVKGNAGEMSALSAEIAARHPLEVTTGAIDRIVAADGRRFAIANGDALMTEVTALGCATGALMAALSAVTDDIAIGAVAALLGGGIAGEIAAGAAQGPGDFATRWIDTVSRLDAATILARARITSEASA